MDMNKLSVLNGIYNHISMDQMAKVIGKSKTYVGYLCAELEREGLVDNPYKHGESRRAVARVVTEEGLRVLRAEHLIR
jgi:DNA-binding MarR family transcriptional regulator